MRTREAVFLLPLSAWAQHRASHLPLCPPPYSCTPLPTVYSFGIVCWELLLARLGQPSVPYVAPSVQCKCYAACVMNVRPGWSYVCFGCPVVYLARSCTVYGFTHGYVSTQVISCDYTSACTIQLHIQRCDCVGTRLCPPWLPPLTSSRTACDQQSPHPALKVTTTTLFLSAHLLGVGALGEHAEESGFTPTCLPQAFGL